MIPHPFVSLNWDILKQVHTKVGFSVMQKAKYRTSTDCLCDKEPTLEYANGFLWGLHTTLY